MSLHFVFGITLAPVLAASAVVYLGAAALSRPAAAWPVFFGTVVLITVGQVATLPFDITWAMLALGVVFAVIGVVRGATRPGHGLPRQTLAYLIFGGLALAALMIDPALGAYVVAVGLLGHAGWDAYHYHHNRVVVRSMSEFCLALDTGLALVIVVSTTLGLLTG